ncbi:MAG: serine/threonine protein kinase, partial [Rhodocyclaceae bacterium]|nr:serine/threonine protein kinase [Rhodocyclaceae bacterium]
MSGKRHRRAGRRTGNPPRAAADESAPPFAGLVPDTVLAALEGVGLRPDGRLLALNSYENRVYQAWMEEGPPLVAKFYRPARWSDAAILEEHAFTSELAEREIPAVPPLRIAGATLHRGAGYRFAVFPKRGGRPPELEDAQVLRWMGRFLGRIHAVGRLRSYAARPRLDADSFGREPRDWLLAGDFIPGDLRAAWQGTADLALEGVRRCYERAGPVATFRLHGDCHAGNVLWTDDGPHFVDFDDSRTGPAIQDLWMLLSGERESMERQIGLVLAGYREFAEFDLRELFLVEALRT